MNEQANCNRRIQTKSIITNRSITMSLSLSPFQLKVFALVRMVPMGYVTTYGEVAKATGSCARAVGQCMRKNPLEPGSGCSLEQLVP